MTDLPLNSQVQKFTIKKLQRALSSSLIKVHQNNLKYICIYCIISRFFPPPLLRLCILCLLLLLLPSSFLSPASTLRCGCLCCPNACVNSSIRPHTLTDNLNKVGDRCGGHTHTHATYAHERTPGHTAEQSTGINTTQTQDFPLHLQCMLRMIPRCIIFVQQILRRLQRFEVASKAAFKCRFS